MSCFKIEGPSTILGGLPVWAEFTYTRGDWGFTDDDFDLDALYWLKRDGTKGNPLPEHMYDRAEKHDEYFSDCFQQLEDNLIPPEADDTYMFTKGLSC